MAPASGKRHNQKVNCCRRSRRPDPALSSTAENGKSNMRSRYCDAVRYANRFFPFSGLPQSSGGLALERKNGYKCRLNVAANAAKLDFRSSACIRLLAGERRMKYNQPGKNKACNGCTVKPRPQNK